MTANGWTDARPSCAASCLSGEGWPYLLVPFIPIAIVLDLAHANAALIFVCSALGVIPTAALMGRATEELAARSGPGIGGLLNVTFGNAPELIIALFALDAGLHEVVKASIIGSILGNILLVLGAAMLVGGLRPRAPALRPHRRQRAVPDAAARGRALTMPAIFELVDGDGLPEPGAERQLRLRRSSTSRSPSRSCCMLTYVAGLFFSLKPTATSSTPSTRPRSTRRAVVASAGGAHARGRRRRRRRDVGDPRRLDHRGGRVDRPVASSSSASSSWRSSATPPSTGSRSTSRRSDKMDLSVNIAIGSSAQIALFAAPVLVLCRFVVGPFPMALVFNGLELGGDPARDPDRPGRDP